MLFFFLKISPLLSSLPSYNRRRLCFHWEVAHVLWYHSASALCFCWSHSLPVSVLDFSNWELTWSTAQLCQYMPHNQCFHNACRRYQEGCSILSNQRVESEDVNGNLRYSDPLATTVRVVCPCSVIMKLQKVVMAQIMNCGLKESTTIAKPRDEEDYLAFGMWTPLSKECPVKTLARLANLLQDLNQTLLPLLPWIAPCKDIVNKRYGRVGIFCNFLIWNEMVNSMF